MKDLHQFLHETIAHFNADSVMTDRSLPKAFKDYVKSHKDGDKFTFLEYTTIVSSDLEIYCPNQWFYLSAYYCQLYPLLIEYKNKVLNIIGTIPVKESQSIIKECLGNKEYANRMLTQRGVTGEERDLLICFLSDYDWWYGGKGIERGDFYYSPILRAANLVNQSQSYVAEICKYLIENPDALFMLQNELNNFDHTATPTNYELLDYPLQQIYYGAPGTGKSHEVKIKTGELDAAGNEYERPNVFRTTFHPDTDYATFVGCYKPTMKPVEEKYRAVAGKEEDIAYEFVPQAFTDAYVYAYNHPGENTFLVIEEINRGNCAQIFGDLFQLLDRKADGTSEYTIKADKDLANYLTAVLGAESDSIKDGKLRLPANLSILATMNTSDQSLFPMDSAFKRRWDWEYVAISYTEPKSSAFMIKVGDGYKWVDFIKQVNKRIFDLTQSEDKELGNFFIKDSIDAEQFKSKVMFYLWYEVLRDEVENSKYFFYYTQLVEDDKETTKKFTFKDLYGDNADAILEGFLKYMLKGAE